MIPMKEKINMSYMMTRDEGNSFNRVHGYEGTRLPQRVDYDRVRNIFDRLRGTLAYENGRPVSEDQIKVVQERLSS